MKEEKDLRGYRIWEIQENLVPKELDSGTLGLSGTEMICDLDLENKTYAIRIGKKGLK